MHRVSLRVPESLHACARDLAKRHNVSINHLVTVALAKEVSALDAEYLATRARRGSREKFLAALARVPDVEPVEHDRL